MMQHYFYLHKVCYLLIFPTERCNLHGDKPGKVIFLLMNAQPRASI
ncbi:hypothetical protein HMPREF0971_03187 [Segatella oris F0302]|uniref:Uncharacterized protein n=1 Tax=Segatella oris F0302 TaxID=649760 RepID=D1QVZ4_9BACT|nr:hypothetical protein HMPREF0971_03187 [Segatella oris F0302]